MSKDELIDLVRNYLDRPNLDEPAISAMIASTEGELNRALREHPRNRLQVAHISATNILPLPVDVAQIIQLTANDTIYRQFPPDAREVAITHGNAFISHGNCLTIFPPPTTDTAFILEYTAFLHPLTIGVDENWVSKYFSDVYLYGILKEAAVYLKDDNRFQLWQTEFTRRLNELIAQGWNQNISTAPTVRVT